MRKFYFAGMLRKTVFSLALILGFVWICYSIFGWCNMVGHGWSSVAYAHGGGGGGGGGGDGGGGDSGGDSGDGGDAGASSGQCADASQSSSDNCMSSQSSVSNGVAGGEGVGFEPHTVLAINPSEEALRIAKEMDLIPEEKVILENLGIVVTRLKVPEYEDEKAIWERLSLASKGAQYDLNHYYEIAGQPTTGDIRHYPRTMISWPETCYYHERGLNVGIVDTGVAAGIPALEGQAIVIGSFVDTLQVSDVGHGTAAAAILVGAPDSDFPGLLPSATLYVAAAFSAPGPQRTYATALGIARGIDWLISRKVKVINLSLAGAKNKLLEVAIKKTIDRGIVVVAAAGNFGPDSPPAYPAAFPGVIAVTAIDRFLRPYRLANRGEYISFSAPGVGIWVPDSHGLGHLVSGTSYAAIYCSAMVALFINRSPGAVPRPQLVAHILRKHTVDLGPPGKDKTFGWGLIKNWLSCVSGDR